MGQEVHEQEQEDKSKECISVDGCEIGLHIIIKYYFFSNCFIVYDVNFNYVLWC